jgi:DNA-binding MurR/RpiR family transcriptional regulator
MNSLMILIKTKMQQLPESERKIAEYILKDRRHAVYMNSIELALKSGSSQSAVIRFCKDLGIPGFHEFKIMLARDVFSVADGDDSSSDEADSVVSPGDIVTNVVSNLIQSIRDLEASIDTEMLAKAAEEIEGAIHIHMFGMGPSGIVALECYHKLERIGFHCSCIGDSHMQLIAACGLGKGDLGIIFSYSGETPEMVASLHEAKASGARIVSLTKQGRNSISDLSDVPLYVPMSESIFRLGASSSRIAQLAVVDILYSLLVTRNPGRSLKMLERTMVSQIINKQSSETLDAGSK